MDYILPNGKKLNIRDICVAMTDDNVFNRYFLNVKTGQVKLVSEEFDVNPDNIIEGIEKKLGKVYFEIPKMMEMERCAYMKEFVDQMIEEGKLKQRLNKVIDKYRTFRAFEKELYHDESGWIHGWVQNKWFILGERIPEWLDEAGIDFEEKWEYDDDCPLCQMLKEAEEQGKNLTTEETKEAFRKAKEKGHIVGGEWLEEGKDGDS